jgi:hypothetical protein
VVLRTIRVFITMNPYTRSRTTTSYTCIWNISAPVIFMCIPWISCGNESIKNKTQARTPRRRTLNRVGGG